MQPYDVKLSYLGKSWVTVPLEVGHNEIGTGWESLYAEAAEGLPVIQDMSEAIDWVNTIISEIADQVVIWKDSPDQSNCDKLSQ